MLVIAFLLSLANCSEAVLATACSEATHSTSTHRAQERFDDRFETDSRANYEVTGAVSWQRGRLVLSESAAISRPLDGGATARVVVRVATEDRVRTGGAAARVFRCWFRLEGAARCCVLVTVRADGSRVALVDTGEIDGRYVEAEVRSAPGPDLTGSTISAEYRHGYVIVSAEREVLLRAYIENGAARVSGVALEATNGPLSVEQLAATVSPPDQPLDQTDRQRLEQAEADNSEMLRFYREGDLQSAARLGREILQVRASVLGESHAETTLSLNNLAALYGQLGEYERAENLLQRAIQARAIVPGDDHPEYAESLHELAVLYDRLDAYERAVPLHEEALKIRRLAFGDSHAEVSRSLNGLAVTCHNLGDYSRARSLQERAIAIMRSASDELRPEVAIALNNLASVHKSTGDYAAAEPLYREAAEIWESRLGKTHPSYATFLNNLASLYEKMGDARRAEPLYVQSLEITADRLGRNHPDYAVPLDNLAALHRNQESWDRAEELYTQAWAVRRQTLGEEHPATALSLNNLADLHYQQGDFEKARSFFERALVIKRTRLGNTHPSTLRTRQNLALLHSSSGQLKQARELFEDVLTDTADVLGERHPDYAHTLHELANVDLELGQRSLASREHQRAAAIVRARLDASSVVQAERQQKQMQSRERLYLDARLASGLEAGEPAASLLQDLWRWKGSVTLRQHAYRQVAEDSTLAPLFDQLRLVSRQLSSLVEQAPLSPPGATDEEQDAVSTKRREWREQVANLTRQRENLEQQIAATSVEFRRATELPGVDDVQQLLPARTAFVDFVEYDETRPHSEDPHRSVVRRCFLAFVLTADRVSAVPLGSAETLTDTITQFRRPLETLSGKTSAQARDAGETLRRRVWRPVEEHLAGIDTVVLSPDTVLGTLPFAALPGTDRESYLVEEYRLVSFPVAGLLPRLFEEHTAGPVQEGMLIVGDVDYSAPTDDDSPAVPVRPGAQRARDREWNRLPGFQAELSAIRRLYRAAAQGELSVLSGREATEERFVELAQRFGTLHIITHGYFEDPAIKSIGRVSGASRGGRDPFFETRLPGLLSGLVLAGANAPLTMNAGAGDGVLRAAEIEASSMAGVDLVVLSACQTGLGAVAGGEGLTGLQRAFHIAGARTVIASLWNVDDRATQELMTRFYTNLWVHGQSRVDALRNAQLHLLRNPVLTNGTRLRGAPIRRERAAEEPERSRTRTDPAYWAAFSVSGDWR